MISFLKVTVLNVKYKLISNMGHIYLVSDYNFESFTSYTTTKQQSSQHMYLFNQTSIHMHSS